MVSRPYTMSELVLAITLTWMNWFWLFFGKNVTESKLWNRCIFPPHITSSSVLCGKTGNLEIASFHLNASCSFVNTQHNKKLSYRRGTARCVASVEILPIATQQCVNYLYDKSWTNWSYEVGGFTLGRCVINMCTQPWRDRVASIGVVNKHTMDKLWKLLMWPWPRPLRKHSLISRLRLRMADLGTKFEVSGISRCGDFTWGVKF